MRTKTLTGLALVSLLMLQAGDVQSQSPGRDFEWACSLDNIGATLTECKPAPAAGSRLHLESVVITSTTAVAGLFLVRTGTGANCGTGTASLLPSAATVARIPYAANTVAPTVIHLDPPLALGYEKALCIICTATNTCTVQMTGFLTP